MACPHFERGGIGFGGFGIRSICGLSKKELEKYSIENVCDTWSTYYECAIYKKQHSNCYITTAACAALGKPDDCAELTVMRRFRDEWLLKQNFGKAAFDDYYRNAPAICRAIDALPNSAEVYQSLWADYLAPCVKYAQAEDFQECYRLYLKMVADLMYRCQISA